MSIFDFTDNKVETKPRFDFGEDDIFDEAFEFTSLRNEGGDIVDDSLEDQNIVSKFGVTQQSLDSFNSRNELPEQDIRDIEEPLARDLLRKDFFEKPKINELPDDDLKKAMFDFSVHSGPVAAIKTLQNIVGTKVDGRIGDNTKDKTQDFIDKNGEKKLLQDLVDDRHDFLKTRKNYPIQKRGLDNRIQKNKDEFDLSFLNPFSVGEAAAAETKFDFGEPEQDPNIPDLQPSERTQFAEDSGPIAVEKELGRKLERASRDILTDDFVGGAIDILTGGMSIPEAERHKDITVRNAKNIVPSLVDLVKFSGEVLSRDLEKAQRFISDPIGALTTEPIPEKTIEPGDALEGFGNIIEFIFNPYIKSARAIGGFVFPEDEGTLKTRLTQAVKDVVKDPHIGFISERIGEDVFTGEEETIERIAKIGGVATIGFIAEVLTFNPRGIFNRIKRFPTDQKIARMNEIIAEVEKDVPALREFLKKQRPDLPPHLIEAIEARDFIIGAQSNPTLGNYLKAVTKKVVGERISLRSQRGEARIPFKKGDVVKIGKETGKFIEEVGGKALVEIAGKEVTKELSELAPEKPVEARPPTGKEEVEPIEGEKALIEEAKKFDTVREFIKSQEIKVKEKPKGITNKISSGLYQGFTFEEAIKTSLVSPDTDIRAVEVFTEPKKLLDDKKELSHYELISFGRKTRKKALPKNFNEYVEEVLKTKQQLTEIFNKAKAEVPRETVPEFKNTEEAIAFGKQATPEQVEALKVKQKDAEDRFDKLAEEIKTERTPEKVQELSNLATKGQLFREAVESSKGKIKEVPSAKEIKPEERVFEPKATEGQKLLTFDKLIKGEGFTVVPSSTKMTEFIKTLPENVKKREAIKAFEKIFKELSREAPKGVFKKAIRKETGLKKEEKAVTTTERAELKRKLRLINKSIKEGIREGVSLEKVRANQKEAIRLIKQFDKTRDQINAAIDLEEAMPAPLDSKSSAFNEHIAYFQTRQIPPGSKVRGLLARIRAIDRLRRAKKIKAGQANRISRNLRRELFNQADKEGVAIRMTPGGKIILAVRQSGVFVPKEFAEYPNFKNLSSVAGGGTDTTRMMEAIDGSLSVAQKKGLQGQAGQAVQQVLWPTRDIMIQKMSYIEEKLTALKQIFSGIKNDSPESILVTKVAEQISIEDLSKSSVEILQNPDVNKLSKSEKIVTAAKDLRVWFTDMIAEINAAREIRNQELIPVRDNYIPHEFLDQILWEKHGISTDKPSDVTEGAGNLPSYIKPNKPFNPREKAREFGIPYDKRLLDSVSLAENYIATAAKDIFNTSIIQNNKAFIQQLDTMGFKKSSKTIADWTAEAFAGIRPVLDNAVNLPEGWTGGLNFFNRLRNMAVFPFNFAWNLLTQTSSITLTLTRYGVANTFDGLLRWLTDNRFRENASKEYFSLIIKSHKQGRLSRQDVTNLIGQDIKIYRKPSEVLEDWGTLFGDSIERLLTGSSIEAARLTGIEKGLKGEALKQFASDGGAKTQSMYNAEDKPGVLRSTAVKTITPYQTFTFEVMNTFKEWTGKTGTPPEDASERILWMIRFMAGVTVTSAIAAKNGRKIWDWFRAPLPFAEYWLNPVIKELTGEYTDGMGSLPSPTQAVSRIAKGINNYLETGDTRKLRNELLKWGPGLIKIPGGVKISRMVDAWIAYANGGIYDRRGRKMFGVETEEDLLRGMFTGVWSTKGGQEYLKKREGKLDFNVDSLLDDILGKDTGKRRKRIKRSKRKTRERRKGARRFNF